MLLFSDSENEFKAFNHSLELINNEDSSVVINKFIIILEMMIIIIRSCSELELTRIEASID